MALTEENFDDELEDEIVQDEDQSIDNQNIEYEQDEDGEEDFEEDLQDELTHIQASIDGSEDVNVEIIGRDKISYELSEKLNIRASRINPITLGKISSVYVKNEIYERTKQQLISTRLIILQGEANKGKYATAINMALEIQEQFNVEIFSLMFTDVAFLTEFLEEDTNTQHSIFIVKNGFRSPGLDPIELEKNASEISLILAEKNSYVIVTTDLNYLVDTEIPIEYQANWNFSFHQKVRTEVIKKHLNYYAINSDVSKWLMEEIANVDRFTATPNHINRIVKLIHDGDVHTKEELSNLMVSVVNIKDELSNWFDSLTLNERYFCILVALFDNVDWRLFYDLYGFIIKKLRSEEIDLVPALSLDTEKLVAQTETTITDLETITFEDTDIQEYAILKSNNEYYPQFTILLESLGQIVTSKYSGSDKQQRTMRIAIASGIGKLGRTSNGLSRIEPVLEKWVNSDNQAVRAAVAYSLLKLVEGKSNMSYVASYLNKWRKNNNWKYRWAFSATLERMFSFLPKYALEQLTKLSNDQHKEVSKSISHAVVAIARRDNLVALSLIDSWINDENPYRVKTAIRSIFRLLGSDRFLFSISNNLEAKEKVLDILYICGIKYDYSMRRTIDEIGKLLELGYIDVKEAEKIILEMWTQADRDNKVRIQNHINISWGRKTDTLEYDLNVLLRDRFSHLQSHPFEVTGIRWGSSREEPTDIELSDQSTPSDSTGRIFRIKGRRNHH